MPNPPKSNHAWRGFNNLREGRKNKRVMFQPRGNRMTGGFDLVALGIEPPMKSAHRVIRAGDIGQQWMRQQAALDYSYEIWRKLLEPVELGAPIVEEDLGTGREGTGRR